jgi:hypothetical protein
VCLLSQTQQQAGGDYNQAELTKHIRDICKVRKRQHQYPEFGHTQGEIQKKPAKKYISSQWVVKLRKPSILMVSESHRLSFVLSTSTDST